MANFSPVGLAEILLLALNFQLFGIVTTYRMTERKRRLSLVTYLSARKSYLHRKTRLLQNRRVRRNVRSVWVINGRKTNGGKI